MLLSLVVSHVHVSYMLHSSAFSKLHRCRVLLAVELQQGNGSANSRRVGSLTLAIAGHPCRTVAQDGCAGCSIQEISIGKSSIAARSLHLSSMVSDDCHADDPGRSSAMYATPSCSRAHFEMGLVEKRLG